MCYKIFENIDVFINGVFVYGIGLYFFLWYLFKVILMKNKIFYNEFWECRVNLILNFVLWEDDFNSVLVIVCYF